MPAELNLRDRDLAGTLADLQQRVRTNPGDAKLRIFLFQLLAILGSWDRAMSQLTVAGELDAGALAMVQMYREALKCEALRAEVFAGRTTPMVFGDPEQWIALLLEAARRSALGEHAKASAMRAEAFESAPTTAGQLFTGDEPAEGDAPAKGTAFEWIADADTRLGPMLEAIVLGRYYWVPFHRVRKLHLEKPADLRDLVWAPAHFEWANGGEAVGLVPTRYPGSEASETDGVRLARRTEWLEPGDGAFHGLGQRMFATDAGEFSVLETRRIEFAPAAEGAGGA